MEGWNKVDKQSAAGKGQKQDTLDAENDSMQQQSESPSLANIHLGEQNQQVQTHEVVREHVSTESYLPTIETQQTEYPNQQKSQESGQDADNFAALGANDDTALEIEGLDVEFSHPFENDGQIQAFVLDANVQAELETQQTEALWTQTSSEDANAATNTDAVVEATAEAEPSAISANFAQVEAATNTIYQPSFLIPLETESLLAESHLQTFQPQGLISELETVTRLEADEFQNTELEPASLEGFESVHGSELEPEAVIEPAPEPEPEAVIEPAPEPELEPELEHPILQLIGEANKSQILQGSDAAELIMGGEKKDTIFAEGGNDEISAGKGNDIIEAGSGNDQVFAGDGNDTVYAQAGNDIVYAGTGNDKLYGGDGDDELFGGNQNDTLKGDAGDDVLQGDAGKDKLYGGDGDDILVGGSGDDLLKGDSGDDGLYGNEGDDRLYGGDGDDRLIGGSGDDQLFGGKGDDYFETGGGQDVIKGEQGADILSFSLGDGQATFKGGSGAWTDVISLDLTAVPGMVPTQVGESWMLDFDEGQVMMNVDQDFAISDQSILFENAADGTITLSDGSEIDFDHIEEINWEVS